MPDTLADAIEKSLDRLIEEYGDEYLGQITRPHLAEWIAGAVLDRERAHIDALTAAVEGLPGMNGRHDAIGGAQEVSRAAVLAILRGDTETSGEVSG